MKEVKEINIVDKEYVKLFTKELAEKLPEGTKIIVDEYTRTGETYKGIIAKIPGQNMSPIMRVSSLTGHLKKDTNLFLSYYKEHGNNFLNWDINQLMDWEWARSRIMIRLLNPEKNKGYLGDKVTIPFVDLVEMFYISVKTDDGGIASAPVTKELAALWEKTPEDIFVAASANMKPEIISMFDILVEMYKRRGVYLSEDDLDGLRATTNEMPQYVISNTERLNGAGCLHPMISSLKERFGKFYVLPSSIHEIIVMPAENVTEDMPLNQMIAEINATEVAPEEVLSDHAYYFNGTELVSC